MKVRFVYLFMGLVLLASGIARADYTGQTINGTLAFGSNGANGGQFWVPSSIVVPGSFFYQDGANIDTAAFTGTQLTVTDQVVSVGANGWEMTFAAPGSPFAVLNLVSSNFAPGITFNLTGGVITVDWVGTPTTGQTLTAVFDIAAVSPVPEPSSLALLGTGCLYGLNLIRRRRA
jgi:hypothetical protein